MDGGGSGSSLMINHNEKACGYLFAVQDTVATGVELHEGLPNGIVQILFEPEEEQKDQGEEERTVAPLLQEHC